MTLLQNIGNQIKQARINAGFTQTHLAVKCKTTKSVISAIEHGKRNISILILAKIVKALGLKLEIKLI